MAPRRAIPRASPPRSRPTWASGWARTAGQLAAAVADRFGITVSAEAIRQHLHALGYAWKRTRYVPVKLPDPGAEHAARAELGGLKRGRKRANSR